MKVSGQLHSLFAFLLPHWLEGRVVLVDMDAVEDVSDSCICQESKHGSSFLQPVAQLTLRLPNLFLNFSTSYM
jgi:hypothetical protein